MKAKVYILNVPYGQYVYAAESKEQLRQTAEQFEEISWGKVSICEKENVSIDVPYTPFCLGGYQE